MYTYLLALALFIFPAFAESKLHHIRKKEMRELDRIVEAVMEEKVESELDTSYPTNDGNPDGHSHIFTATFKSGQKMYIDLEGQIRGLSDINSESRRMAELLKHHTEISEIWLNRSDLHDLTYIDRQIIVRNAQGYEAFLEVSSDWKRVENIPQVRLRWLNEEEACEGTFKVVPNLLGEVDTAIPRLAGASAESVVVEGVSVIGLKVPQINAYVIEDAYISANILVYLPHAQTGEIQEYRGNHRAYVTFEHREGRIYFAFTYGGGIDRGQLTPNSCSGFRILQ